MPGFCPWGSGVYSGWFCRGGLCLGCFVRGFVRVGGIYQGVLSGGVCPGGFVRACPRGVWSIGGFCPAEYCPWGFVRGICSGGGGGCPRIIFLCRGKGGKGVSRCQCLPLSLSKQTNLDLQTKLMVSWLTSILYYTNSVNIAVSTYRQYQLACRSIFNKIELVDQLKQCTQIYLQKIASCIHLQIPIEILKITTISDMHHCETYMYNNFQQNRVSRSVRTVNTN